jgi:hypothetical protein
MKRIMADFGIVLQLPPEVGDTEPRAAAVRLRTPRPRRAGIAVRDESVRG